jgi:predicted N-acetyltransferase YhbS
LTEASLPQLADIKMKITMTDESPNDVAAVDQLLETAFLDSPHSNQCEHYIVQRLRAAGDLSFALVARDGDKVVGYAAVSPVAAADETGWYGLGPVAVSPEYQYQGIGSHLMREVLMRLRDMGAAGCVALGEPEYYKRFGFRAESGLQSPQAPQENFMALAFDGPIPRGEVSYADAFRVAANTK